MFRFAPLFAVLLFLGACAATEPYRAAEGGGAGYSEIRLSADRWRVQNRGAYRQPLDQVEAGLLLRSAQVAREAGYERFIVIERGVDEDWEDDYYVRPSFGFGMGWGGWSRVGWGLSVPLGGYGGPHPERRTAFAEIRALPPGARTGAEVYEADALIASLSPVLTPPASE